MEEIGTLLDNMQVAERSMAAIVKFEAASTYLGGVRDFQSYLSAVQNPLSPKDTRANAPDLGGGQPEVPALEAGQAGGGGEEAQDEGMGGQEGGVPLLETNDQSGLDLGE